MTCKADGEILGPDQPILMTNFQLGTRAFRPDSSTKNSTNHGAEVWKTYTSLGGGRFWIVFVSGLEATNTVRLREDLGIAAGASSVESWLVFRRHARESLEEVFNGKEIIKVKAADRSWN